MSDKGHDAEVECTPYDRFKPMEDSKGQVVWFSLGDSDLDAGPATYLASSRREKLKGPELDSRYLRVMIETCGSDGKRSTFPNHLIMVSR